MKVFITREIPKVAEQKLKDAGFEIEVYKKNKPISKNELIKSAKYSDGILSLLTDKFTPEIIDKLQNCKVIANYAVGYNNIDVEYANEKGITVCNTPDILTDATADIALTLILACARRLPEGEKLMRQNKFNGWQPKLLLGMELKGKTVGIIGAGRIGQATAKRLKAFGTKIIYYNRTKKVDFESELNAKKVSLKKLLASSDIISLHLPLTNNTFHLLDKTLLSLMKPTTILINTARGEIVDENELIKMLKAKKIFSAGFDVYENEPNINPQLLKLDNVVLLPHLGSATFETRDAMAELAAENIIRVLKNKKAKTPVGILAKTKK